MAVTLTNAHILDGTGSPWFRGSVVVDNGEIASVTTKSVPSSVVGERVDVDGSIVAPGFIDSHSHSDLRPFADPTLGPKIRQGITTEIAGQDGFSMAPLYREGDNERWHRHLEGFAGPMKGAWTWGSLESYLDAIDECGVAANIATAVGHGTVRYNVLGMEDQDPTDDELEAMADLVSEALEQGAIGFSTGLVYDPQRHASTDEVRALAARLEPTGRPLIAHIRSEGRWIWDALDEFYDIGDDLGVPIHHSHIKLSDTAHLGKADRLRNLMDAARERGIDVTADQYPYRAGSTPMIGLLPPWATADGEDALRENLADPDRRTEIRRDIEEWRLDGWENIPGKIGWDDIYVSDVQSDANHSLKGRSFADIAEERETHPVEVLCDVLLEEDLGGTTIEHGMVESDVQSFMADDRIAIATDGLYTATPHPRLYGTYPRVLGHYCREENHLSLANAVRKMTALPARVMGLDRKGIVRPGMDADLAIFDPDIVASPATYDRPRQYPTGIDHVLVDGTFVVRDGSVTGELPGETLRHDGEG